MNKSFRVTRRVPDYCFLKVGREEAAAIGQQRYWPAAPCVNGHLDFRNVRFDYCMSCRRKQAAASHIRKLIGEPTDTRRKIEDLLAQREINRLTAREEKWEA